MKHLVIFCSLILISTVSFSQEIKEDFTQTNSALNFIKAHLYSSLEVKTTMMAFDGAGILENKNLGAVCSMVGEIKSLLDQADYYAKSPLATAEFNMFRPEEVGQLLKLKADSYVLFKMCEREQFDFVLAKGIFNKLYENFKNLNH